MTMSPISLNLPPWLRWGEPPPTNPTPPKGDLIDLLRAEFQNALATERQERVELTRRLDNEIKIGAATAQQLEATRQELTRSRDFGREQAKTIGLLQSTVESLQTGAERATAELINMTTQLSIAEDRYNQLRQDTHEAKIISQAEQQKLHERVAQLESTVDRQSSEIAGYLNRAQIAEAQVTWLSEENAILRAEYVTLGGNLQTVDSRMADRKQRVIR